MSSWAVEKLDDEKEVVDVVDDDCDAEMTMKEEVQRSRE